MVEWLVAGPVGEAVTVKKYTRTAAERKAARDAAKAEGDEPGRGLGRGRAAEVHAILLAGGSPSELPSHGERVSGLARAFDKVKADYTGRDQGLTNEGGDDGDGEDEGKDD